MPKTKKIKLKEDNHNFTVFAIVSSVDDYHLVWHLNNTLLLNLSFMQHPSLKSTDEYSSKPLSFFYYEDEKTSIEYSLIGNKHGNFYLFRKLESIDFVLKISGNLTDDDIDNLASKIRSVKEITACIYINVKKTPEKGIFERI